MGEISIADISIAELLTTMQLFHNESLESHPNIHQWFLRVRFFFLNSSQSHNAEIAYLTGMK